MESQQIKIEPEWEDEINIKQLEGQHLKIEEKLDTKDSCTVQYTDIEIKLFSDNNFKIKDEEIYIKNESEQCLEEVDKNTKQLGEKYLKIEEKLDFTKDSYTIQYTDIFSDNSFKIEEEKIHIKDESEQLLEEVDQNSKNFEEGGCQQRLTNDEEKYKCNICKHTFSQECNLYLLVHTSEKIYVCVVCEKSFNSNVKKIKCNVCEKSFTRRTDLKRHLLIHSVEKTFKCNVCKKSFTRKSQLKEHLLIHSGDKSFKCNVCEKSFNRKSDLNRHLLIHSDDKNLKCNICEKSFTRKSYLNTHLLNHSGKKNFKCNVCKKSFTHKCNLNSHLLIHSGEKNFKCSICAKSFNQKSHLTRHLRTHSGEKNFKCDVCKKSFTRKSSLKKHVVIHSGHLIGKAI